MSDAFVIAGKPYSSRLLIGTGKYKDFAQTRAAVEASGAFRSIERLRLPRLSGRKQYS